MNPIKSAPFEENKIILEERRLFLIRIDKHTLSVSEYTQGISIEPLKIKKEEFQSLIERGVLTEKLLRENDAYPPQAILSVSFQEEALEITITDIGIVQIHRKTKEAPEAKMGPNPVPSETMAFLKGTLVGKLVRLIMG